MDRSLSDSDISPYVPNILTYTELEKVSSTWILSHLPLCILYLARENYGHWTLLHKTIDEKGEQIIEFFDPYGIIIDGQFKYLPEMPHYMARMLLDLSKIIDIHYNEYQFQDMKDGINTCGRWSLLRCLLNNLSLEQFRQSVVSTCERLNLTPDELVVKAIKNK